MTSFAICIISFSGHGKLEAIIAAIRAGDCDWPIFVLLSCGPIEKSDAIIKNLSAMGVNTILPETPLSIGESRYTALKKIGGVEFIAFVDDDCTPAPLWSEALRVASESGDNVSMIFGPREERSNATLGGYIREREAKKSNKTRLSSATHSVSTYVVNPRALCAGGNMSVRVSAAERVGIYDPAFENRAFEDVDLQMRLISDGGTIVFSPAMKVVHEHPIAFASLVTKSISSGRGVVICKDKHADQFSSMTRWSRWQYLLIRPVLLSVVFGLCIFTSGALGVVLATFPYFVIFSTRSRSLAWLFLKPLRDLAVVAGMALEFIDLIKRRSTPE